MSAGSDSLEILVISDDFLVVHKPSALLVHRSEVAPEDQQQNVLDHLAKAFDGPLLPVHRLDRPTSGVLLIARSSESAKVLGDAFAEKRVSKRYLGLVRGWPVSAFVLDRPLMPQRYFKGKARDPESAKPALTRFKRLRTFEVPLPCGPHPRSRYSLLECFPETGRTHQIRRHLKHSGYPLVGDSTHGDARHNRLFKEHFGLPRLFLHASSLSLFNESREPLIEATAPLPPELQEALQGLEPFECQGL